MKRKRRERTGETERRAPGIGGSGETVARRGLRGYWGSW